MEELYRRVSDNQTIGSVVQELRGALVEIEKHIDQYFRQPQQPELLFPVPGQLSVMRGVVSVLGLDAATQAHLHPALDIQSLRRAALREGMQPLRLAGVLKVAEGLTTLEEILRSTPAPDGGFPAST